MSIIHFAHANGFPARTYTKLFDQLPKHEVRRIEMHGHDPVYPVTDGWGRLKDELRDDIKRRFEEPVIGIGHSLGGLLHLMVAAEEPQLYRRLILLDAPVISRLSSRGLYLMKTFRLIDRLTPSRVTRYRRRTWATQEEALEHFRAKPMFKAFDPDVLADYVRFGTNETTNGVELAFQPKIEAAIYRTLPHHMPQLKKRLTVPAAFIGGTDSREGRLARLGFMKKNFPFDIYSINGSHLFPLENPIGTAKIVKQILDNENR